MANGIFTGVNNVARKIKNQFAGVNNVARNISKGYVGVSNIARQFFQNNILTLFDFTTGGDKTAVTGGWSQLFHQGTSGDYYNVDADCISIHLAQSGGNADVISICTVNNINLSDYTKFFVELEYSRPNILVNDGSAWILAGFKNSNSAIDIWSLDNICAHEITDASGSFIVEGNITSTDSKQFVITVLENSGHTTTNVTVKKIWFE